MNVQTEQLENHRVRLTVEIEPEQFEKAKHQAARKLSRKLKIPGFRKGKAPYPVVVTYVGEPAIIEDAIDELGNEVYRSALDESGVVPYAPGALEDFQIDPAPKFVFSTPLQPTVDLKDYRDVRFDYEEPTVSKKDVDEALESMRQSYAETEEVEGEIDWGHRVTVDIHSEFADDPADDTDTEEETPVPQKGDNYFHEHAYQINLKKGQQAILKGLTRKLIGAEAGAELEFDLKVPDEEEFEGIVGRKIHFHLSISKAESVELPELDDEFAAKATEHEDEPKTLKELRDQLKEDIKDQKERAAAGAFSNQVLEEIIADADMSYPDEMIGEQIDDMMQRLESQLQQQGMKLDDYVKISDQSLDDIRNEYQDQAEETVRRTLVLQQLLVDEDIQLGESEVDDRIEEMLSRFGDGAEQFREYFDTPDMRLNLANEALTNKITDRLVAIGRGLAEDIDDEVVEADETEDSSPDEENED